LAPSRIVAYLSAMLRRTFAALAVALALALGLPAGAQTTAAQPAPAASPVSADELERLVTTLQDESARARLVEQLRGLVAAQRGIEAEETPDAVTWLGQLSKRLDAFTGEILATAQVVIDVPWVFQWMKGQLEDDAARERWLEATLKLGIIFGFALFAEWLARTLLRRPREALAATVADGLVVRLACIAGRAVLEAVPLVAFAAVAWLVLPMTEPRFATERIAKIFIEANVWARVILVVARTVLLPHGLLLFLGLTEESRTYLLIWIKRFTNVALYGWAIGEAGWWFGVPGGVYAVILKLAALVLAVLAIVFVLQNRVAVAEWVRGREREPLPGETDERALRRWRLARNRLADVWHVLAIVYIVGIWSVYALRIEGGFFYIVRATFLSIIIIAAARVIVGIARRASRHGFAIGADLKHRFPSLETRANRYLPILTTAVSVAVYGVAALTVLQAWDVDSFAWFESPIGRRLTGGIASIVIVLLVALVAWEVFSSTVERYLSAVDEQGRPMPRSARARTLLPLFRTSVAVLLVVMVSLIVLSELGVNIAPLLAGAGVVGLAIGFGSQALVKDVITGLFILIEDTLAVGDVVDVGKEHSGVVERITIRSIRLRDETGAIHTVPFSEVTSVKNLTRDFSYYVASIGVAYREDIDEVEAVIKEVGEGIRTDPALGGSMLEPIEIIGVDKFEASAVVIKARLKTLPIHQWKVGREFNRRLKKAFDEHGIEMPYPHQTIYFGTDKRGEAPPARILVEQAAAATEESEATPPAKRFKSA
jgi:small conductance mechanosensitive channel